MGQGFDFGSAKEEDSPLLIDATFVGKRRRI